MNKAEIKRKDRRGRATHFTKGRNKGSALDIGQVNKDLPSNERLKLEIESLKEMSHFEG